MFKSFLTQLKKVRTEEWSDWHLRRILEISWGPMWGRIPLMSLLLLWRRERLELLCLSAYVIWKTMRLLVGVSDKKVKLGNKDVLKLIKFAFWIVDRFCLVFSQLVWNLLIKSSQYIWTSSRFRSLFSNLITLTIFRVN